MRWWRLDPLLFFVHPSALGLDSSREWVTSPLRKNRLQGCGIRSLLTHPKPTTGCLVCNLRGRRRSGDTSGGKFTLLSWSHKALCLPWGRLTSTGVLSSRSLQLPTWPHRCQTADLGPSVHFYIWDGPWPQHCQELPQCWWWEFVQTSACCKWVITVLRI